MKEVEEEKMIGETSNKYREYSNIISYFGLIG